MYQPQPQMMGAPMLQVQCGQCGQTFGAQQGVPQVLCPFCQAVNQVAPPTGQPMGVPVAPPAMGGQPQMYGQPPMGGQPMMCGAPPQQMMAPLVQIDPFQILNSLPEVKIVEKMNMLETAAGLLGELMGVDMELEMANKYVIQNPQGHNVFFAVEQTDFCQRNCCGDCRAIDIDIVTLGQDPKIQQMAENEFDWSFNPLGKVDLSNSQKFLKMQKEMQCTCCCFNRPIIDVTNAMSGQSLGKIRDPWACCDMTFQLMDGKEEPTLTAKGGCCQLGLICPCPCGPCSEVHFAVSDAKTGAEVAHIKKVVPDCLKFIVADDVDNYEIDFRQVQHPDWKAMLIALGLFIDFRYFNTRSDKNDQASEGLFGGDDGGGDFDGGGDE